MSEVALEKMKELLLKRVDRAIRSTLDVNLIIGPPQHSINMQAVKAHYQIDNVHGVKPVRGTSLTVFKSEGILEISSHRTPVTLLLSIRSIFQAGKTKRPIQLS